VTLGVLAPVFFVAAGLRVDLGTLTDPTVLAWGAVYLAVSVVAKLVGAGLGGLLGGLPRRSAALLAVGLNCRGAVEVVVASTGLALGVLSTASYTVVVLMALLTTVMAPPLLRLLSPRDPAADFVRVT
jgi:Kef-type K+ transport system membrane component KefB